MSELARKSSVGQELPKLEVKSKPRSSRVAGVLYHTSANGERTPLPLVWVLIVLSAGALVMAYTEQMSDRIAACALSGVILVGVFLFKSAFPTNS